MERVLPMHKAAAQGQHFGVGTPLVLRFPRCGGSVGHHAGIITGNKDLSARKDNRGEHRAPQTFLLSLGRDGGPYVLRLGELEVLCLAKHRWK